MSADLDKPKVMKQLREDLQTIHYRWRSVLELWYPRPEWMRIMASYGHDFFDVLQRAQIDDLILSLARFADVPKEGKYRNVNLSDAIKMVLGAAALKEAMDRLGKVWVKIKDIRDRVLAHRDYDLHVAEKPAAPLAGMTFGEIRAFIDEVTALMQSVDQAYDGQTIVYGEPIRFGSWEAVFGGLLAAEHLDRLRQRAASGLPVHPADIEPPKPQPWKDPQALHDE